MARAVYHLVNPDSLNNLNTPNTAMCGDAPKHLVLDSDSATCKACILAHALLKIRLNLSPNQIGYAAIIDIALARVRESA